MTAQQLRNSILQQAIQGRIVHAAKPTFNYRTLSFDFPNGLTKRVRYAPLKINGKHNVQ